MSTWSITGPAPRPDTRIQPARTGIEHRAQSSIDATDPCPACGNNGYDVPVGYCVLCGFQRTNNGNLVNQRSAHHPCPGCQSPTTHDRCEWCRHWEAIEARAMARHGTITEREVSRLGRRWH